jgi:PAS domain S-box-containing protein
MFGYTQEEMIGRTTLELGMWVDPGARRVVVDRLNAVGHFRNLEVHARRRSGETFWVSYSARILAIEGPQLLMGVVHDITEEKRAADALRQAEEKYRSIYENAVEGMFRTTPDGKCVAANPAAARLLGYSSPEEAMAAIDDTRLQVWADPAVRDLYVSRLEQEEIVRGFECQLRRRDGSLVWVALSTRRVAGPTGKTLYYDGFMEDVSERRQAEAELREAEELYRGIFEGAAEGIYRAALAGRISAANTTMARILGYDSPAQVIEAAAAHPVPPWWLNAADRDRFVRLLETQGWVSNFESQLRRRDGKLIWAMTSARLVRGTDGRPLHYEGFITDITEKRQLEEQFLRVQRLENIGMLAAGIAHDLNNVLAPIGMAAQLLRLRHTDPTDVRILSMLESSAGRGAGLVRQILGFARGVSGAPQLVQVKHLLRDLSEIIRETFPKSIVLEQDIPKDLWPVMANPTQLNQVLLNLCVNARDAMPNGGTLRLAAEKKIFSASQAAAIEDARPGTWIVLHVQDSGTGMPPEVAARIWEPFFTTKSEGKGTGLGLPTVRGIVETHGGFITLETEVGRGTRFHIHLPAAESTPETTDDGATAALLRGNGEKILFADDESTMREMVADTLTILGYVAVVAANGAQAIELFRARPDDFALVVTDLEMPVTSGRAFAQMVRALRPQLKILAASGLEKGSTEVKWQEYADDYLQKPFTAGELIAAVQRLLRPTINGTNPPRLRSGTAQPFAEKRG